MRDGGLEIHFVKHYCYTCSGRPSEQKQATRKLTLMAYRQKDDPSGLPLTDDCYRHVIGYLDTAASAQRAICKFVQGVDTMRCKGCNPVSRHEVKRLIREKRRYYETLFLSQGTSCFHSRASVHLPSTQHGRCFLSRVFPRVVRQVDALVSRQCLVSFIPFVLSRRGLHSEYSGNYSRVLVHLRAFSFIEAVLRLAWKCASSALCHIIFCLCTR